MKTVLVILFALAMAASGALAAPKEGILAGSPDAPEGVEGAEAAVRVLDAPEPLLALLFDAGRYGPAERLNGQG